jgi:uncharacterized Zn finger protein (UPF0148 family)
MLDYRKYIEKIKRSSLAEVTCPHCGSGTITIAGQYTFCNFCEQHTGVTESEFHKQVETEMAFAEARSQILAGRTADAEKKVADLLKATSDPKVIYLSGVFYLYLSNLKYGTRNYELPGFMEENAENVSAAMDFTSKWKGCFYNTMKIMNAELFNAVMLDTSFLLIKFLSEVNLGKMAYAEKTLKSMRAPNAEDPVSEYANMVYAVDSNGKDAEIRLERLLDKGEINSFYYLAKYFAKQHLLDDADAVLKWLNGFANIFMAQELQRKIESSRSASEI